MEGYLSLIILVFLPLVAGLFIALPIFPNHVVKIRRFAKGLAGLHLIYSCIFLANFDFSQNYNFTQTLPFELMPQFGITLSFTVDALSCLMCVLTSFIFFVALVASKTIIQSRQKVFYSLMLLLETAILGVFCAKDLLMFFLFWQAALIPAYFLISLWGGAKAKKAAMKFLLYVFGGSIFMLAAIAFLYAYYYNYLNAALDIPTLLAGASSLPDVVQFICFLAFLLAFAVQLPIFPLHNWLADAHTEAPAPVSMVLAGVLTKTAAYGLIKFNVIAFGGIMGIFAPWLILLGVIGIIWSSCCAFVQPDMKRMISLSSIAHMGIILIGICSMTKLGLVGSIFHIAAHGLIITGLFFGAEMIYQRYKTYKTELLGGVALCMPYLAITMLVLCLACSGIPLTAGFVGEFMSISGAFATELYSESFIRLCAIAACLCPVLTAAYILKMYHKVFFYISYNLEYKVSGLSRHQASVMFVLAAAVIILGVYPEAITDVVEGFSFNALMQYLM